MTPEEHLEWRISALLDGELGVTEEIVARRHLEGCDHCQQEFAEVMAARSLVRELGEVEPPQGFLDKLAASRASRFSPRMGLVGLVTLAAAWVIILAIGLGVALPDVSPPVDEFAAQHAALAEASTGDERTLPERADGFRRVPVSDMTDVEAPYVVPSSIDAGLEHLATYDGDGAIQVLYGNGDRNVSVFQQEGALDWSDLPSSGRRIDLGGTEAWLGTARTSSGTSETVLVIPKGSVVYTVVTDAPPDDVMQVAQELPESQSYSVAERARRNLEALARRLGLGAAG